MADMQEPDLLLEAYLIALGTGLTQESIAKGTKIPVHSLRKFKQGEPLGGLRRLILNDWLKANGFLSVPRTDPALIIAKELRNLADVLESGIDVETKRMRLASLLDAYGSGRALRAAEESTEYGR